MKENQKVKIELSFEVDKKISHEAIAQKIEDLFNSFSAHGDYKQAAKPAASDGINVAFTDKNVARINVGAGGGGYETRLWEKVTCRILEWQDIREKIRTDYPEFNVDINIKER